MTLFEFYTSLRKDVLKQISGVEDSNGYFSWDNTTPNYLIKSRLESLLKKYIIESKEFGVYVVTRYANCANRAHDGYPIENKYGLETHYQDGQFVWGQTNYTKAYESVHALAHPKTSQTKIM